MQRIWSIFSQTVAVCLAIVFILATLRPAWVHKFLLNTPLSQQPTAVVKIQDAPADKPDQTTTIITSYAGAVELATPSVVNVYTTKRIDSSFKNLPDVPALRAFIQEQARRQKLNTPTDLGSGVIATADGYILTNYHVVEAADSIEIALYDGRKFQGKFIGADPDTDLAVLKIEAQGLVPIPYDANEKLHVGDVVLAIGNPFDVGQTTTMGIISALGRSGLGFNTYENFIQTDAAINPGNSGGALINVNGNLIGINTAIYSEGDAGGSLGIGFATPAETALKIMHEIIETGKVTRGWLGVELQEVTTDIAKAFNLKETRGVIIASVVANGPAAKAKLAVGDIVVELNQKSIISANQLMNAISPLKPGTEITLKVLHNGKTATVPVVLGTRPD
ncbi:trypsin-like peptidase domain-containing protein [Pelistega europaea]|uniref:PDZ domain-containing protein n=1 Tax=Pelistega europaea TaxID=106147 RepID=A0A7Y4LB92_9BURK|nr:trypsin-like peptidase domain-containing protein [Pelistega europaea]NOL50358.1 PDZ domain-containing protein [Pelistega europaea]